MKRAVGEPERWSDRVPERSAARSFRAPAEDDLGALFRRVREATIPAPLARPAVTERARDARWGRVVGRLALAAAVVAASGGAVKAARSVWRAIAPRPHSLTVPPGSRAVVSGRAHRKLTLLGPARLDLDRADDDRVDVTLEGGALTAEAGDEALLVEANGLEVALPAGASGRVAGTRGAPPAVDALAGELRVTPAASHSALALAAGHRWPERPPPAPVPRAPAPPAPTAAPTPPAAGEMLAAPAATVETRIPAGPRHTGRSDDRAANSEADWLARAFHAVRTDHDGQAALQALDERARRFPSGALASEARVARVEALLALGRTSEALPLLLEMQDRSQGLTRAIQLARAEILAEQNSCREAITDFDDLLATDVHDNAGERALYGRAACLLRTGETTRARQDLERYGALYPDGRFSPAVRRAVQQLDAVAAP